jgi:hypothetical protein
LIGLAVAAGTTVRAAELPTTDPRVDQLIENHIGAIGGYMEGYDGAAWEWLGDLGIVVRTVGHAAGATRRGADFEGRLVDWREKGSTVTLHSGESVEFDGRPTDWITVTTRDDFARDYFIDRESHLIVAERRTAPFHAFGEQVVSETRIGDYRPVAGVLFAHRYVATEIGTGRELSSMQCCGPTTSSGARGPGSTPVPGSRRSVTRC